MKKTIFILVISLFYGLIKAETPRFVNVEALGINGLMGLSFDSRFHENSKIGYRIGVGYGFERHHGARNWYITPVKVYNPEDGNYNYLSIPMDVHYLFGKEKHFLETGLGVSLFMTNYNFKNNSDRIGYFTFGKVAYRYESKRNPLLLSAGVVIPVHTPGSGLSYTIGFTPSITIGYRL